LLFCNNSDVPHCSTVPPSWELSKKSHYPPKKNKTTHSPIDPQNNDPYHDWLKSHNQPSPLVSIKY
jgi:hypothetical protein